MRVTEKDRKKKAKRRNGRKRKETNRETEK